jgi:hypothetical protein
MDIHTLSTSMVNQAAAGAQGALHVQQANAASAGETNAGDSVTISEAARAKAASTPAAPGAASAAASGSATQSTADTLARRVAKLQKQLQQEQGAGDSPEDKAGKLATLRSQIRQLQSQQKNSGGDAATSYHIKHA